MWSMNEMHNDIIIMWLINLGSLLEAKSQIQQLVPKFSSLIVSSIAELCMQGLESANTLPRQYRRTNKEVRVSQSVIH